jgi:hypothetical protein
VIKMANEVFMDLISSEFSGEEATKVEYASLVGFALDSIKRKETLEAIYKCYVPFYALKVNEGNYIVVNALQTDKSKLTVSKVPTVADIKPVLNEDYSSLEELYKAIESALISKSVHNIEMSGALVRKSVEGMAKMIVHHNSSRDSKFKKLTPLVKKEDVKRDVSTISKFAITDHELETELNILFDEIERFLAEKIVEKQRIKSKTEEEYSKKIEETKREGERRIREIEEEEKTEKRKIDEIAENERKEQIVSVRDSKRWNQLKKDIAALEDTYARLLSSTDQLSSGDQFDVILTRIRAVQDETQAFGTGLNTAVSEIEFRQNEYEDIRHQADVDKRNVSDRMNTMKEDIRRQNVDLELERNQQVQMREDDIQLAQDINTRFHTNRANLMKKIKNNYIMFSAYSLSAELLGASHSEQVITLNVPVAICKYKERTKLHYLVIPPIEISDRMKKPRLLPIHGLYVRIGFDCIASEAIHFLKKPLENLLSNHQGLQAEIQGESNEVIGTGDLSLLNAGLNILEQRKKMPKKYSDEIVARSRTILS